MSESNSVITKVLETESGKFIANKLFGKLEKAIQTNTNQREVDDVLATISPISMERKQEIFEKISDRYLTFRTLLSRERDVFIDEIYHPLRLKDKSTTDQAIILLTDNNDFNYHKIACIEGKAGQGKTTILRKMFIQYIASDSIVFPLIITLRKVDWSSKDITPAQLVSNEFRELGVIAPEHACSYLLQIGRIRIFYDGFDEVELHDRGAVLKVINETHTTYGAKCIVTSRPGTEVTYHGGAIKNYELLDLNRSDVEEILKNHSLISDMDKRQLNKVIESKPEIADILLTPIIVDIFISTYNSLVAEPTTIVDFYEQLFQALASTHDRLKVMFERKGKSGLNNSQLQKVFQSASFILLKQRNEITFRNVVLEAAFKDVSKKLGFEADNTHEDVIDKTSLIQREGSDYSYLHKSILEFFAAKHIKDLADITREKYYSHILSNYSTKHENVLRYLRTLDEELFYTSFIRDLLDRFNRQVSTFNLNNYKLNKSVATFVFGSDEILISKFKSNNSISFDYKKTTMPSDINILKLIFSSVLDADIPIFNHELLGKQLNLLHLSGYNLVSKGNLIKSIYKDNGDLEYEQYNVSILNIFELFEQSFKDDIKNKMSDFYFYLVELDKETEHYQNIYEERNALSQFL